MNQLRRKGRSKRRNSKLRNSRMKTRVKRQYKRKTSRVKRNTYRKNRKRHTKRRIRGGYLTDEQVELLDKWENYQKRKGAFKHLDNFELEERPVANERSIYFMDLGNGSLRKEAESELERLKDAPDKFYQSILQSKMNEYLNEIMMNFPSLKYLDISDNGLKSLPELLLKARLRFLNIQGNPKLLYDSKTIELIQELMKRYNEESVQLLMDSKGARPKN